MADICTVVECTRPVRCKSLCKMHYERWRVHGDPHVCKRQARQCTVEGCDNRHIAKGFCYKHYDRTKRHGNPHVVLPRANQNTHKTKCKNGHILDAANVKVAGNGSRLCRLCSKDYQQEWYETNKDRLKPIRKKWRHSNHDKMLDYGRHRYLQQKNQFVEKVERDKVFRSCKGMCGICGKPVSQDKYEIDHIIPVALGGLESYDNVQIAHPTCNKKKGKTLPVGVTLPLRLEV